MRDQLKWSAVQLVAEGTGIRTNWIPAAGSRLAPVDHSTLGFFAPQYPCSTEHCCAAVVISVVHALVKAS